MIFALNFMKLLTNINNHIYTELELKKYIYALIDYLEVKNYFRGVLFNNPNVKGLATYSFKTKKIKINYNLIINEAKKEYTNSGLQSKRITFINLELLQAIYHEVMHVIHNYMAFDSDYPIGYLYLVDIKALNETNISDEEYMQIHDLMLIEREANITSLENILIIIKKYIKDNKLFCYYLNKLRDFMLDGYQIDKEIISPMEYLYKEIYHLEVPHIGNIDLYDKIKLGIPINKNDLRTYMNKETYIILKKNNLQG